MYVGIIRVLFEILSMSKRQFLFVDDEELHLVHHFGSKVYPISHCFNLLGVRFVLLSTRCLSVSSNKRSYLSGLVWQLIMKG